MLKASVTVGSASEQAHYQKLLRDYDQLTPEMQAAVDEMGQEYKHIGFSPAPIISVAWDTYHAIRQTKGYDYPVTYTDLYHYSELLRIRLEVWEVKAVIAFDRTYYIAYAKYHDSKQ